MQRNIHSPDMRARNGSIIVLSINEDAEKLNTGLVPDYAEAALPNVHGALMRSPGLRVMPGLTSGACINRNSALLPGRRLK